MNKGQSQMDIQSIILDFENITLFIPSAPILKPSSHYFAETNDNKFSLDGRKYSLTSADTDCSEFVREIGSRRRQLMKRIKKSKKIKRKERKTRKGKNSRNSK